MCTRPHPRSYEDVRVVKETGLRSVGASLVGSIPTPRKRRKALYRYSLVVRIGLFHSLGSGSIPGIGIKFGASFQKAPGDHTTLRLLTAIYILPN